MDSSTISKSGLARLAFAGAALLTLTACQIQTPADLLLAPTYDSRYVPETYGTKYACKAYRASGKTSGWRGIVGGKKYDFDKTLNVSREGCFETQAECRAFLTYMSGYVDFPIYSRCQPI
ncbi:hypothetical protein [Roseibium sp.]|uniref:hypothetical protein n=1 Tax=Roseibium sp. TaxID=1936156 RepID=UPI003A96C692